MQPTPEQIAKHEILLFAVEELMTGWQIAATYWEDFFSENGRVPANYAELINYMMTRTEALK